jgi:hypothetical protein
VLYGVLEPARPQFEQRPLAPRHQLQKVQAEVAGQPIRLGHVPQAVLAAPLAGFHAGQRDECFAGQELLPGGLGQLQGLAA